MNHENFLAFAVEYGRAYLACGGPTGRLEQAIGRLSKKLGLEAEVFATPTGIFISARTLSSAPLSRSTELGRIQFSTIQLAKLSALESLLEEVMAKPSDLSDWTKKVKSVHRSKPIYRRSVLYLAAFLVGVSMSFPLYASWFAASMSGLITIVAFWIAGPGMEPYLPNTIFRDFIACFVTLSLASLASWSTVVPLEAFSIGGMIFLVPGLALTTAISDLAEQNYLAGTARLMKAVLTLLALGMATLLFQDLVGALISVKELGLSRANPSLLVRMLGAGFSVLGFAVLFYVPPRNLAGATLTGLSAWFVLSLFGQTRFLVMASFAASATVGFLSLGLGKWSRQPSQVFSVPGVLALLPGMVALSSFRAFAAGAEDNGLQAAFQAALLAGAIVFGLFAGRIPIELFARIRGRQDDGRAPAWHSGGW